MEALEQMPLLGERGRRKERTEWGTWMPARGDEHGAYVAPAADRAHAEAMAGSEFNGPGAYVVSRQVVIYTTNWTRPGGTP